MECAMACDIALQLPLHHLAKSIATGTTSGSGSVFRGMSPVRQQRLCSRYVFMSLAALRNSTCSEDAHLTICLPAWAAYQLPVCDNVKSFTLGQMQRLCHDLIAGSAGRGCSMN
eukprot:jgi/Ulvmu1/5378/UM022_0173.1